MVGVVGVVSVMANDTHLSTPLRRPATLFLGGHYARDRWSLPKRTDPTHTAAWSGRELGYKEALRLLGDAGLAPRDPSRR